jgi:DNA-binding phage protein
LQLTGSIESQLRDAYARLHHEKGETQSSVAAKLGVDRSAVHRRLSGQTNMTVETMADMVWALGQCIKVEIFDPSDHPSNETRIVPVHQTIEKLSPNQQFTAFKSVGKMSSSGTTYKKLLLPDQGTIIEHQS